MTHVSATLIFAVLPPLVVCVLGWTGYTWARRAGVASPVRAFVASTAVMLAWLGVSAGLARSGFFANSGGGPPREPMAMLVQLGMYMVLARRSDFGRMLDAMPLWLPIAIQTYRVAVEYGLWRLHVEGMAPVQVTAEGRNIDIVTGVSAPLMALAVMQGRVGWRAIIAWNVVGMGMLLHAIGTAATSIPGPLRVEWAGEPFSAIRQWPVIWLPAVLAPTAMFLHVTSIRQALRRRRGVMAEERS